MAKKKETELEATKAELEATKVELEATKVELAAVIKPTDIVTVDFKGQHYEVSGDVANILIAANRAVLVK